MLRAGHRARERLDSALSLFPTEFLHLSQDQQAVSVSLYRLLAEGEPVGLSELGKAAGVPDEKTRRILDGWPGVYSDEEGRIIGFWGLALPETDHRFQVQGRTLYTWCAWDSLFIPAILQGTAQVESRCPETGQGIGLTVSPNGVEELRPSGVVMSFLTPDAVKVREDVIVHFCHYVHFFSSSEAGSRWVAKNPGTYLLSLEEAYQLGRKKNAMQFQDVLALMTSDYKGG